MPRAHLTLRIKSFIPDVMLHGIMNEITSDDYDPKKRDKNAPLKSLFDCPDIDNLPKGESCTCFETSEPVRWYSYEEDMCRISKKYKGILFQLDARDDEDSSAISRTYFMNGKTMLAGAVILYEPFNVKYLHKLNEFPHRSGEEPSANRYASWEE